MYFCNIKNAPAGFEDVMKMIDISSDLNDISLKFVKGKNLSVKFDGQEAVIEYEKNYAYRALSILCEKLNVSRNSFEVVETPVISDLGVLYDVSRNAPLNLKEIKRRICIAAIMGYSTFMLYTEDMYELENYPYFGYMRGRYTRGEIKEIDSYAAKMGITLIPCMQAASHLEHYLKWYAAMDVRDTGNTLLVGAEKTYELIEAVIKNISECFTSKKIFIGMDEASDMGTGRYKEINGERAHEDIYFEHLKRVNEIVKKYNLSPMMWDDMLVALGSDKKYPHDENVKFPHKDKDLVPDGMKLVYWDYCHTEKEHYKKIFKSHKTAGFKPGFMGSGRTESGAVIKQNFAMRASVAALEACIEEGIDEVWIGLWGDSGGDCDLITAANVMQLYAEYAFGHSFEKMDIPSRLSTIRGFESSMFDEISQIDEIVPYQGMNRPEILPITDRLLWQDPLYGLHDRVMFNADFKGHYRNIKVNLMEFSGNVGENEELLQRYIALCDAVEMKCRISIELKNAYETKSKDEFKEVADSLLASLKQKVEKAWETHRKLWFKHNKPFGWEVFDVRYGAVLKRIDTAEWRISEYCNGRIDNLEELETETLYLMGNNDGTPGDDLHLHTLWWFDDIVTAGKL